mgnify:FL=1
MKRNAIRIAKLENKLIRNRSDVFRLSDLEILERIEALEFQKGMRPTQKFINMKKASDKTMSIFTPKVHRRMQEEQAEMHAQIEAMNDVELDDHLNKLIIENEMEDTFEDMSNEELKKFNKPEKETLV